MQARYSGDIGESKGDVGRGSSSMIREMEGDGGRKREMEGDGGRYREIVRAPVEHDQREVGVELHL